MIQKTTYIVRHVDLRTLELVEMFYTTYKQAHEEMHNFIDRYNHNDFASLIFEYQHKDNEDLPTGFINNLKSCKLTTSTINKAIR